MRPGEVAKNLTLFADSLANISYIDLQEAKSQEMRVIGRQNTPREYLNDQAAIGVDFETGETFGVQYNRVLSDLEQLRYTQGPPGGEILVADASTSIASMRRDDIHISLGALRRITEYADRLARKERRVAGQATKILGAIVVRQCLRNLEDDDIAAKVGDYEIVLPLLGASLKRQVNITLSSPSIQNNRHLGEGLLHVPRSSWVPHEEGTRIIAAAKSNGLSDAIDKCYPYPARIRQYIATIEPFQPPNEEEFLDALHALAKD